MASPRQLTSADDSTSASASSTTRPPSTREQRCSCRTTTPRRACWRPRPTVPRDRCSARGSSEQDGNWGLIGGFLWSLTDSWRLGGVYRQGPDLGFTVELRAGEALRRRRPIPRRPKRQCNPEPCSAAFAAPTIELPAVLGLGLAYRAPDGRLTVSFQWDRIDYSSIAESLGDPEQAVDDADELHLGGEYVFLDSTPIVAVRLGMWLGPRSPAPGDWRQPLPTRPAAPRRGPDPHHPGPRPGSRELPGRSRCRSRRHCGCRLAIRHLQLLDCRTR